jgi:gliding motility-associated-like protein
VAAGAVSTAPTALATCDTDYVTANGIYTFDLNQEFDSQVLNGQDPTLFTVAYFATEQDAIDGTNPITTPESYPTATGTIWIVVTNETTFCRSAVTSAAITVEALAEPEIKSTTGSDTICVEWGTDALLRGLTLESGITDANYTFVWSLDGAPIAGAVNSTYVIDALTPTPWAGVYTVIATSTNPPLLGCASLPSTLAEFTVIQSGPAVLVGSGYTVNNAFAENQTITVTVQGHGVYHYQLDNGPIVDNGGVFENVSPGLHSVQVYDVKGNTSCDPLLIDNIQTINYPHYFTPNGDGIHDTWNIIGLSDQPNAKIYIFDRYGKLIKQISPKGQGWDGTYNGQLLPSTDYWFTVEFLEVGVTKEFKAHFSLKR